MDMIWCGGDNEPFSMDTNEWMIKGKEIMPINARTTDLAPWYVPHDIEIVGKYVYAELYLKEKFCYYSCIPREWWDKWQTI